MKPDLLPKKPLILIADDDKFILETLIQYLEHIGYAVIAAENGEEAISLFFEQHPDMVLLDANMPRVDGFQACKVIKDASGESGVPVVMVTALEDEQSVIKAFEAGAEEYITKPIHWAVLRQRIRKILERKAMEKALRAANEEMENRILERTQELRQNIEARILSESLLKISETKFRSLVETSPDTIMILDQKGHIQFINHPTPFLRESVNSKSNIFYHLPSQSRPRYKFALNKVFFSHESDAFMIEGMASTWWQTRIIPLPDQGQDTIESAMVVATDITEKQTLQSKAIQNTRLATVGTLAAGVAHEVNNPNNAILLQAEWLQDAWLGFLDCLEEDEEKFADLLIGGRSFADALVTFPKFIAGIIKNARRVGLIAENLKRMSRPDNGKLRDSIQIKTILQAAQSILANQIQKYTDSCTFHLDEQIPSIRGNAQQLEQVFINLLLNALQALRDRQEKVDVFVSYHAEYEKIVVQIQDEGVGIPEENLGKIRNPFFTTKLEQGGTGLGLAISHSIINNHNGCMDVVSTLGEGTTVKINLPCVEKQSER